MARKIGNMDLSHPHYNPTQIPNGNYAGDPSGNSREIAYDDPKATQLPKKPPKASGSAYPID